MNQRRLMMADDGNETPSEGLRFSSLSLSVSPCPNSHIEFPLTHFFDVEPSTAVTPHWLRQVDLRCLHPSHTPGTGAPVWSGSPRWTHDRRSCSELPRAPGGPWSRTDGCLFSGCIGFDWRNATLPGTAQLSGSF